MQKVDQTAAEVVPGGHKAQVAVPSSFEIKPGVQSAQRLEAVAPPVGSAEPALHLVQLSWVPRAWYCPGAQLIHQPALSRE